MTALILVGLTKLEPGIVKCQASGIYSTPSQAKIAKVKFFCILTWSHLQGLGAWSVSKTLREIRSI